MASLFEGLQTQTEQKDADANGSDLFGSLSVAGETGTSAFSFLNATSEVTSSPVQESVFSFLQNAEVPASTEQLQTGGGSSAGDSTSPLGESSAFGFIGTGSPTVTTVGEGGTGGVLEFPESGTRRKTRKALLPGHASRPQEETRQPVPAADEPAIEHKNLDPGPAQMPAMSAMPALPEMPEPDVQPLPQQPVMQVVQKPPPPPEPAPMSSAQEQTGGYKMEPPSLQTRSTTLAELQQRLAETQAEQDRFCENDQFEEAEALETVIEELRGVIAQRLGEEGSQPVPAASVSESEGEPVGPPTPATTQAPTAMQALQTKPPPPPEPAPSVQDKLQRAFNAACVRQWLEDRLDDSDKEQFNLLEAQASCLSASQKMADNIAEFRQQLAEIEAEQNRLCDAEQFEEADALDAAIQELKDKISKELEEVALGAKKMITFAESLLSLTRDRVVTANQAFDRAEVLQKEGAEAFQKTEDRCHRHLQAEEARIEAERKRMDLAQSHIEKDSQNLKEEWQQVTEAIDQQTTEDTAERDKAALERAALDEEIQELERRLSQKLEQRKSLTEVVDSCDIRIACIRAKFEKQLGRLEGKQKRLEEAQREVEVDSQQVQQMEAELGKERQALREQELQHQDQMKDIRRASRELRKQRWFLSTIIQRRVVWQRLMEPYRDSLNEARQKWEQSTQKCAELSTSSMSQEAEAAKLRSQIDATAQALPGLEAEKKLAVASRSFKEAGRLTEEIRRREEGKKKFEQELESLQAGLASAREELAACRQGEQDAQEELLSVEEKCAFEELRVLRHQVCDLEDLRKSPSLGASAQRLYSKEVEVLKRQQEHLSKKYGVELASLEDIPMETIAALQEGEEAQQPDDSDSESDAPEAAEEALPNGNSEPQGVVEMSPASDVEMLKADEHPQPKDEDEDPEASSMSAAERAAALKEMIAEVKVKADALEPQIEKACEVENFDLAEELESERKKLTQTLEDAEKELSDLKNILEESCEDKAPHEKEKENLDALTDEEAEQAQES